MYIVHAINVEEAYLKGRALLSEKGVEEYSRNGAVKVTPCPVMTVYEQPNDRVLLNRDRNANHAFHINEAIWMLSGSNDARWLDQFIGDFSSRYANDDGTLDGAYGHRWRRHFSREGHDIDQLEEVIAILSDKTSRRAVIAMHDAEADLNVITKDQPCNTHIYLRVQNGALDLTVMCRSNDIIWGAYGANAVHFSVLQEYLAAAIGVEVGRMYQFSNNWHAYVDVLKKTSVPTHFEKWHDYTPTPLVTLPTEFIKDCEMWVDDGWERHEYANAWFTTVLTPIRVAYRMCKLQDFDAAHMHANLIQDFKWRKGMFRWIHRKEDR